MLELEHIGLGLGGKMLGVFQPVGMVGNHRAAGTGGDDLVAVEAVTADVADGARKLACEGTFGIPGAQGFGSVLNQNQAVPFGNIGQTDHVGHVAEYMNHAQCFYVGAGSFVVQFAVPQFTADTAELLHGIRVDAQRIITADEDGLGTHITGQRIDGGNEGQRGDNDLIPAGDPGGHGGQVQGAGTGIAGYGAPGAQVAGQRFFKFRDLAAAGGHPPRGDGFPGQFSFTGTKIRDRKRDKLRHNDCLHVSLPLVCGIYLQIYIVIIQRLPCYGKRKLDFAPQKQKETQAGQAVSLNYGRRITDSSVLPCVCRPGPGYPAPHRRPAPRSPGGFRPHGP